LGGAAFDDEPTDGAEVCGDADALRGAAFDDELTDGGEVCGDADALGGAAVADPLDEPEVRTRLRLKC
jgi:hypothetical protein